MPLRSSAGLRFALRLILARGRAAGRRRATQGRALLQREQEDRSGGRRQSRLDSVQKRCTVAPMPGTRTLFLASPAQLVHGKLRVLRDVAGARGRALPRLVCSWQRRLNVALLRVLGVPKKFTRCKHGHKERDQTHTLDHAGSAYCFAARASGRKCGVPRLAGRICVVRSVFQWKITVYVAFNNG